VKESKWQINRKGNVLQIYKTIELTGSIFNIMEALIQRIRNNIKSISIHVLTWALILMINFIFLKYYVIHFDLSFHILIWVVYILLFYISYSLLIPLFLFKKKVFYFVAGSLIVISSIYFINQIIARNQFKTVFNQTESTPWQNFYDPHAYNTMPQGPIGSLSSNELDRVPDGKTNPDTYPGEKPPPPGRDPGFDRKLFLLYGLLLVYFASISVRVLLKFRDDEEKKEEIMEKRISTELLYLKQQVNPHFLFNTLNNIYALSIKNPEITPGAILKVSSILRYTLYKSDNSLALLKDEIEIIIAYIDFQKMRFKNGLPITYNVSGSIDDFKIEPFILLPLIENAFKYGMVDINNTFINIQITIISDKLKFLISNKKNFRTVTDMEHSGIGIKNIKRRLDLVYPDCHKFKIVDEDEIFSVFLELPKK
jgi:two-component system, LytTR family, sensor kinase